MKGFEDGNSSGTSTTNKRNSGDDVYNLFRSPTTFFHMLHLIFSIIWWLLGWDYRFGYLFQHRKAGFQTHALGKMCDIRILQLNYVQLKGSYNNFPKDLRWLCMHGFPFSYIPSPLRMENMVALDMTNSNLKQLWKKPKLLTSLKFLNLSCCRELVSVGSFCRLPSLERLILSGCTSLVEVCESIGNYCDRLEVLDLSQCVKLKKLPRSLEKLKKLTSLSLNGCSIGSLQVVESNDVNDESQVSSSTNNTNIMEAIPRSPKSFVIPISSSLVSLSLQNNNLSDASFPKNFHGLSMLKSLDLKGNPIESLPKFVRSLNSLEMLFLSSCSRLATVLYVPYTIIILDTQNCVSLKRITFSSNTSTPRGIYCHGSELCNVVEGILKIEGISEIEEEIFDSLGWINIKDVKDFRLRMTYHYYASLFYQRKSHKLQMIYEKGVFNTCFEGKELPYWITHRSKASSISITIPSCRNSFRIQGLNVCLLTRLSKENKFMPFVVLKNLTKNCFWGYLPTWYLEYEEEIGEEGRNIIWLSHSIFGNNEFENGDEVGVVYDDLYYGVVKVRGFGISFVYEERNKKQDPLASYKSQPWKHLASRDLSNLEKMSGPSSYVRSPLENW